jgi:hypothetical protein
VVGTYDGATLRLYVNGVLVATTADAAPQTLAAAGGLMLIGEGTYNHGGYGSWFYGGVSEVSIWGVALTAADVLALATAGGV